MANAFFSGTIYLDTTNSAGTAATNVKVAYIVFRAAASNDALVLCDGTSNTDPIKFSATQPTAKATQVFDFSRRPLQFKNGVFVKTLTSGAEATLYTTTEGASS